jgi:hypothetical protein
VFQAQERVAIDLVEAPNENTYDLMIIISRDRDFLFSQDPN